MIINKIMPNNNQILHQKQKIAVQNSVIEQKNINLNNIPYYAPISFGAKSNADKLEYIGKENFPNEIILKKYEKVIENGEKELLRDIHKDFYNKLLECKTLDEAKKLYPEFQNVIDANEIPKERLSTTLKKFTNGNIEDVKLEDLSLTLIKKHYAETNSYTKAESYWGLSASTVLKLFKDLNIKPLNREYFLIIFRESPEYRERCSNTATKNWQNEEYREKCSDAAVKRWEKPEYRAQQAIRKQEQWENPEYRAQQAERMRELHKREGFSEKQRAAVKAAWADPEKSKRMADAARQNNAKRWESEEARKKMSEIMKARWQDPEYREKIISDVSEIMKIRWQDPNYIAFKTQEKLDQWADPEFHKYMSETMKAKWQDPEYREKMAIYSEALKLAWEMHPEISEKMKEIAEEFPSLKRILDKIKINSPLTQDEELLLSAYYKKCHAELPGFTKIVGETQKEILAQWKKEGIIS